MTNALTIDGFPIDPANGRPLCTVAKPRPQDDARKRWAHEDVEELSQEDGYPGGDIVTYRCKGCGITWKEELPQ